MSSKGKYRRIGILSAVMVKGFSAFLGKKKSIAVYFSIFESGVYHLKNPSSIYFCGYSTAAP